MCVTGTESQRILVMCMKQLGDTLPMGAFDHKGHCIYANTPLASMLGYKLKVLKSKDISQLLPQPYGVMHLKYVKVRVTGTWGSTGWQLGFARVSATIYRSPVATGPEVTWRPRAYWIWVADLGSVQCLKLISRLCCDSCHHAGSRAHAQQALPKQLPQRHDQCHVDIQQHTSVCHSQDHPAHTSCSSRGLGHAD